MLSKEQLHDLPNEAREVNGERARGRGISGMHAYARSLPPTKVMQSTVRK